MFYKSYRPGIRHVLTRDLVSFFAQLPLPLIHRCFAVATRAQFPAGLEHNELLFWNNKIFEKISYKEVGKVRALRLVENQIWWEYHPRVTQFLFYFFPRWKQEKNNGRWKKNFKFYFIIKNSWSAGFLRSSLVVSVFELFFVCMLNKSQHVITRTVKNVLT